MLDGAFDMYRLERRGALPRWLRRRGRVVVALLMGSYWMMAAHLPVAPVELPALRLDGVAATAHTQGLEIVGKEFYVTARRDDVRPQRALLLKTAPGRRDWEVWDITPSAASGETASLNHPGGMQSDGQRLWIPLAESRRHGRSLIRVFPLAVLSKGRPPLPELEFLVEDHIGAVAVSAARKVVIGASWDTERVYVWDLGGRLQRILEGVELEGRGLGAVNGTGGRAGLAVQDWKLQGKGLFASGLLKIPGEKPSPPASRWLHFTHFLEPDFQAQSVTLPLQSDSWEASATARSLRESGMRRAVLPQVELGHEAMALNGRWVYFLPEDLGATNRAFRVARNALQRVQTPAFRR